MSISSIRSTVLRLTCLAAVVAAGLAAIVPAAHAADVTGHENGGTQSIIGGYTPDPSQWPWMVALVNTSGGTSDYDRQFCGGALIEQHLVLTAAHCVYNLSAHTVRLPGSLSVLIGKRQLSAAGGDHLAVSRIVVDPQYGSVNGYDHDLAVLYLASSSSAQPAALIGTGVSIPIGSSVTTMGWGMTHSGNPGNTYVHSDNLTALDTAVWSDAQCQAAGTNAADRSVYSADYDAATMICAGNASSPQITCHGDSGSPMMIRDSAGTWRLLGMVSLGSPDCNGGLSPTVYSWLGAPVMDAFVRTNIQQADAAPASPAGQPGPTTTTPAPGPGVGAGATTTNPGPAGAHAGTRVSLRATLGAARVRSGRTLGVRASTSGSGTLSVTVLRGGRRQAAATMRVARTGAFSFTVPTRVGGRLMRRGVYQLRMVLHGAASDSNTVTRSFRVR